MASPTNSLHRIAGPCRRSCVLGPSNIAFAGGDRFRRQSVSSDVDQNRTMHPEIVRFYDTTFVGTELQETLLSAPDVEAFKTTALAEAERRGFVIARSELDETLDGCGLRDTFSLVDFGSPWISKIMSIGWVPKECTRS